jgi:hypothetical protein
MAIARKYQIGDRRDKLTVTGFDRDTRGRNLYLCRCDCGNTVKRRASLLTDNITNNCGCAPRGRRVDVGVVNRTFFYRLQRGAKVRGIPFNLSMKYLDGLFRTQEGKCAFTGLPLTFSSRTRSLAGTASIDRINSARGYYAGNVQWVHKELNMMKGDLPEPRFKELCLLVAGRVS